MTPTPLRGRPAGTKLLAIARKCKPVIVVAKRDRQFRSVAKFPPMFVLADVIDAA
jgi:hypothetical protein